ncbi:MAG: hypothetical protein M3237_22270 [Actinomycetota bacterium]|nr:hypothetical protein [Actinomycetota bacterium]
MPVSRRRRNAGLTTVAASCLLVAGCSGAQEDAAADVAADFYQAVATGEGEDACAVLAPATLSELEQSAGKPCPEAVLGEDVPEVADPGRIEVFGTMAQVHYDQDVAFLTRFEDGWRVVAAACTPASPRYDCSIQGA